MEPDSESRQSAATRLGTLVMLALAGTLALTAPDVRPIRGAQKAAAARPGPIPALPGELAAAPVRCRPRGPRVVFHGPTDRKQVALTFDDGPWPSTPDVLELLKRHDARATFFVLGREVAKRPSVLQQEVADGHAVGNHSMNHVQLGDDKKLAKREIKPTSRLIKEVTGAPPCIFRPPYGSYTPRLISQVADYGMEVIRWNVDTQDALGVGPDAIVQSVIDGLEPGAIILLHDGGSRPQDTLAALPRILREIDRRGYQTVTVPKLLGLER